ncbi:hypothetical protein AB1K91_02580 [Terribacillus sp. 179-K 1B1 HS]|uniref:hypothetical protein n=1 Tax=Terribacillus sp. 179-K 1B1 HS TaxID=3142388 RepID=UPI00399F42AB
MMDTYLTKQMQKIHQEHFVQNQFNGLVTQNINEQKAIAKHIKENMKQGLKKLKKLPNTPNLKPSKKALIDLFEVSIDAMVLYQMGHYESGDKKTKVIEQKAKKYYEACEAYIRKVDNIKNN